MSRRTVLVSLLSFVTLLPGLLFFGRPTASLLREQLSDGQTPLFFSAASTAPVAVRGAQIYRGNNGTIYAMEGSRTGAGFDFVVRGNGLVTAMVSAQTSESGAIAMELEGPKGTARVGSSFGMRHRAYNLTPLLSGDGTYTLWFRPFPGNGVAVREVVVRQSSCARYPRLDLVALVVAVLFLIRGLRDGRMSVSSAAAAVGSLALALRWGILSAWVGQPLQGDAIYYAAMARDFLPERAFETGMREPLHVWSHWFTMMGGGGPFAVRTLSAAFSVGTATLLVPLGARLFSSVTAGAAAGVLFAVGNFHIWNAVRGERSEMFVFLMAAFLLVVVSARRKGSVSVDGALGLLAGLLGLTWLIGPVCAVLAYGTRLWDADRRLARAAIFSAALLSVVGPHLIAQKRTNGDAFFALNTHTSFYRTAESTGVPSYSGERTPMAGLLLKEPGKRLKDLARGYASFFFNPAAHFNRIFLGFHYDDWRSALVFPFLAAGLVAAAWRGRWWAFLLALAVINISPAMLDLVRDPRLFLHGALFVALFFGEGVSVAAEGAHALARRLKASAKR